MTYQNKIFLAEVRHSLTKAVERTQILARNYWDACTIGRKIFTDRLVRVLPLGEG